MSQSQSDAREARAVRSDRVASWTGLVLAPMAFLYAGLQVYEYAVVEAGIVLVVAGVLLTLSPLANRSRIGAVHYLGGVIFLAVTGVAFFRGGLVIAVLPFGIVVPVAATVVSRPRAAAFWLAAMVPQALLLGALEHAGLTPPKMEANMEGALIAAWSSMLILISMVIIQERLRLRDTAEREEMQRRIVRANQLEAMARLAGGVAHDFNNLLSIVASHARVLGAGLDEHHPHVGDVEAIERAAEAGARLTHRLLAIGREDQGREVEALNMDDLIAGTMELLRKGVPETISVEHERSDGSLVVLAEPRQLEQVVMNLAINARDAMPRGGTLRLRTYAQVLESPKRTRVATVPAGTYAILEVSDDGCGMSEELLDRVLEPFFTTKERDRGTGLGLAVVDGVTTTLGGFLDIESREGVGSTFRIYLPMSQREVAIPAKKVRMPAISGAQILLVEDEPAVRRATRRLLHLDGYNVLEASDADDALAKSDGYEGVIDVLVTDVVMPGLSGAQLAQEMRARRPNIGVVYFSGYAGDVLGDEDIAAGRTVFLRKPATRNDLSDAISGVYAVAKP